MNTTRNDLADKIASAKDFTGFAWRSFAEPSARVEITDDEKDMIVSALRARPPVAEGVREELISRFPEINPGNYNDDDVEALNNWGLEVVAARSPAPDGVREALEKAAILLESRATGYDARGFAIFSGNILAEELRSNADEIRALQSGGAKP